MWYIHTLKKQNYTLITTLTLLTCMYSSSAAANLYCWAGDGVATRFNYVEVKKEETKIIHAGVSYAEPIWSKRFGKLDKLTCRNETTQPQRITIYLENTLASTKLKLVVAYEGKVIPQGGAIYLDGEIIPALGVRTIHNFPGYDIKLYLNSPATTSDEQFYKPVTSYNHYPKILLGAGDVYTKGFVTGIKEIEKIRSSPCAITTNVSRSTIPLGTITTEFLSKGGGVKNNFSVTVKKENAASCTGLVMNLKTEFIHNTQLKDGAIVLTTENGTATGALMQLLDDQGKVVPFNKSIPLDLTNTNSITNKYQVNVKRDAKTVKFTGGKFSTSVVLKVSYI